MCTFLIYHDPDSAQPLTMASTRDEALDRQTRLPSDSRWDRPQDYWNYEGPGKRLHLNFLKEPPDAPPQGEAPDLQEYRIKTYPKRYERYTQAGIQGPKDPVTGGMFAGINRHGMVVAINNLEYPLDVKNKLARGGLVLDALACTSAISAAKSLYQRLLEVQTYSVLRNGIPCYYPAFNLIIADQRDAFVLQCGPIGVLPPDIEVHPKAGKVEPVKTKNGEISVIGDLIGHHRIVSLERIPPRTPTMICGWAQNDGRSMRTKHFLPLFTKLVEKSLEKSCMPHGDDPASWSPWFALMQERTKGQGSAHSDSIAQPPFPMPDWSGMGTPTTWATLSTSLFSINKDSNGDYATRMYYSPSPPSAEHRMEFQRIKTDWLDQTGHCYLPKNVAVLPASPERKAHAVRLTMGPQRHVPILETPGMNIYQPDDSAAENQNNAPRKRAGGDGRSGH